MFGFYVIRIITHDGEKENREVSPGAVCNFYASVSSFRRPSCVPGADGGDLEDERHP